MARLPHGEPALGDHGSRARASNVLSDPFRDPSPLSQRDSVQTDDSSADERAAIADQDQFPAHTSLQDSQPGELVRSTGRLSQEERSSGELSTQSSSQDLSSPCSSSDELLSRPASPNEVPLHFHPAQVAFLRQTRAVVASVPPCRPGAPSASVAPILNPFEDSEHDSPSEQAVTEISSGLKCNAEAKGEKPPVGSPQRSHFAKRDQEERELEIELYGETFGPGEDDLLHAPIQLPVSRHESLASDVKADADTEEQSRRLDIDLFGEPTSPSTASPSPGQTSTKDPPQPSSEEHSATGEYFNMTPFHPQHERKMMSFSYWQRKVDAWTAVGHEPEPSWMQRKRSALVGDELLVVRSRIGAGMLKNGGVFGEAVMHKGQEHEEDAEAGPEYTFRAWC